jgi:hypothetical protein
MSVPIAAAAAAACDGTAGEGVTIAGGVTTTGAVTTGRDGATPGIAAAAVTAGA